MVFTLRGLEVEPRADPLSTNTSHDPPFSVCLSFSCCLLKEIALFYAILTSAGSPDPVTSLIPHHRPDWLYQPDFLFEGNK